MATLILDEKDKGSFAYELAAAAYLFNRSESQVRFLFELCGKDLYKYIDLEVQIKRKSIHHCPTTVEEINQLKV